jgi:hypothetical protein
MNPQDWQNTPIYRVVVDLRGFERVTLEVGPLVPARCLWRILKTSRQNIFERVRQGRFRIVTVMGEKFVPVQDVEKWESEK